MKSTILGCAAGLSMLVGAAPALAANKPAPKSKSKPTPAGEQLTLDSYHPWNRSYTPPVATAHRAAANTYWVATVSGTFSYYSAIDYTHPQKPFRTVCGTPEPSAQHPGSLGGDGPVGFDAEFIFSRPAKATSQRCDLPSHWPNFQANTGRGWHHPAVVGGTPATPTANHTYSFALVGDNAPLKFRLRDVYTRDNYGLLKISIHQATATDCSAFGAKEAACQASASKALAARTQVRKATKVHRTIGKKARKASSHRA